MRHRLNQTESVYMEQRAVKYAMSWRERHPACSFSLGLCQHPTCGDAEHASWPDLTRVSAWAPEEMTETAKSTETHLVATYHHLSILKVQLRRERLNRNLFCCNMTEVGMKKRQGVPVVCWHALSSRLWFDKRIGSALPAHHKSFGDPGPANAATSTRILANCASMVTSKLPLLAQEHAQSRDFAS
jgi:hypothetical protein